MRDYSRLTVNELEEDLGRRASQLGCKLVVERLEDTAEFRAALKQVPPLTPDGFILFSAQGFDRHQALVDLAVLLDHEREREERRK